MLIECKTLKYRTQTTFDCFGRRDRNEVGPGAVTEGYWKITQRLFHEMIHIAESLYGWKNYYKPNISTEDYTYTCTKKCFPKAIDCNENESDCLPCDEYKLPNVKEKCKNKKGEIK